MRGSGWRAASAAVTGDNGGKAAWLQQVGSKAGRLLLKGLPETTLDAVAQEKGGVSLCELRQSILLGTFPNVVARNY